MIQNRLPQTYLDHLRDPIGLVETGAPGFSIAGHATMTGRVSGSITEVWIAIDRAARIMQFAWRSRYMPRVVPGLSALAAWIRAGDAHGPGVSVEGAMAITPADVADRLGGLPGRLVHETIVGPGLLREAITDYLVSIGLPDPSGRFVEAASVREPPCACLPETAERLRAVAGNPVLDSAVRADLPACASCRAFAPGIHAWHRWRRRGGEGG